MITKIKKKKKERKEKVSHDMKEESLNDTTRR